MTDMTNAQPPVVSRDALIAILTAELGDSYDCQRVWSAWDVGTMDEGDFSPVNDRVEDIADAILALSTSKAATSDEVVPEGLRDAAENLVIGIGMGWDLEGLVSKVNEALAVAPTPPASDAGEHPLARMVALDEAMEAEHPGWMTGATDTPAATGAGESVEAMRERCARVEYALGEVLKHFNGELRDKDWWETERLIRALPSANQGGHHDR